MAFVLEQLTDDQREQMGFARTMDDVLVGKGMSFVDIWVINKETNIFLLKVHVNSFELHFNSKVINIKTKVKGYFEEDNGVGSYINYEIRELVIPRNFEYSLEEIQKILVEVFRIYGKGYGYSKQSAPYQGKIFFSDTIEIRFAEKPKSKAKISDVTKLN